MRFIDYEELRTLVPYTRQHIARLEDEGKFPEHVKLGDGRQARIVWVLEEVLAWMKAKLKKRDEARDEAAE